MNGTNAFIRRHRGSAKTWLLMGIILLLAIAVPIGLYLLSNVSFGNGTTGANLSTPNTGTASVVPPAANPPANFAPAPNPAARPAANAPVTGNAMDLLVVDAATKTPLTGMSVQSNGNNRALRHTARTDANGHVRMPIPADPANPGQYTIRVSGKGYLPKSLEWVPWNQQENHGDVPTSYTMTMTKGVHVHGKIVDDAGQPVAGASVALSFQKDYGNPHEQVNINFFGRNKPMTSGDDGSWSYNGAPPECDQIGIVAWDSKHVSDDFWSPQVNEPASKFYDGSETYVLQRGLTLDGVVLGPDGSSVQGASVGRGQGRGSVNAIPAVNTDTSGHFSYQYSSGQQVMLIVTAKGLAPHLEQFTMGDAARTLTIHLDKAHRIAGKVVGPNGNPVRGANISIDQWQGVRALDVQLQTNAAGEFHWNEAPAEPVTAEIYAPGQRQIDNQTLIPDRDNLIKLGSASRVIGTVTDAETGQPVKDYKVELGIQGNPDQQVTWQPGWNIDVNPQPGRFQFDNEWTYPGIAVKVTARGYLPAESRIIKPDEGNVNLDLKMKHGTDLVLTLHAPDGSPATNATAIVVGPGEQAFIQNGRMMQNGGRGDDYSAGPDGKIDIPPQSEQFKIVILADAGYAQADQDTVTKSTEITLAAWAKIQGTMMLGSKPAAGQWVDLNSADMRGWTQQQPMVQMQYSIQAGDDGKFSFDRVAPGRWMINRRIPMSNRGWSSVNLQTVEVSAAQTVTVAVGGKGRPVDGKVILPPALVARTDWTYAFCQLTSLQTGMPQPPQIPASIRTGSPEARQKWVNDFTKTDQGKAYMAAMQKAQMEMRNYPFSVSADGTFHIDDVEPGIYQVSVDLRQTRGQFGYGPQVGEGFATFTMPQIPGGHSDDVLQLDPIPVSTLEKYNVGDVIADVPLESAEGKTLRFSDYRGKYLLIGFFRTMDLNVLRFKSIYSDYAQDNRVAMLQIPPDPVMPGQTPQRVDSNPWQEGFVPMNRMGQDIVSVNFNNREAPGAWLIGPDGKVIAEALTGDAIKAAISAALGPPPAPATQPTTMP